MGLADVLAAMWSECEAEDGMHFNGQAAVAIELVDPESGRRVDWTDGASGEVLYTTFLRDATPVVRYASADQVVVTGVDCACGRTSPRIRCVGRTDDMLIYKGMNVFPTAIRDVALATASPRIEPYLRIWKETREQVRFDVPIPVEIEAGLATDPDGYAELASTIEQRVRERLQIRVAATIVPPGTLPRSSHKTPLVAVREAMP
jgi:phenylacetate-CoA ligase/benzoylacetate-CoA ligase